MKPVPHIMRAMGVTALATLLVYAPTPTVAAHAAGAPANPDTNSSARQLLSVLQTLPNSSVDRVLSGQMAGYPNANDLGRNSFSLDATDEIHRRSGLWPKIIGGDYAGRTSQNYTECRGVFRIPEVNATLKKYAAAGGYVTLSLHLHRPDTNTSEGTGCKFRDNDYDLNRALPSGADRAEWLAMLDLVAAGLQDLENAGVAVLLRPLQEMNIDFAWYSAHDPALFKTFWRDMVTQLGDVRGLDNLLWVFSPDDDATNAASYYPGDEWVDVIAPTVYTEPEATTVTIKNYAALIELGKPFGIGEFGPRGYNSPATGAPKAGLNNYDFRKLINSIRTKYPRTTYFLTWHDNYRLGNGKYTTETLTDPWVLNRGESPGGAVPATQVMDNGTARFRTTGAWASSTGVAGYYGADYLHDGTEGADTGTSATWMSPIRSTGTYRVYLRWATPSGGGGRPDAAPVEINYNGGTSRHEVNQTVDGGQWMWVDTRSFTGGSGDSVTINGTDDGYTIADAVLLQKQES